MTKSMTRRDFCRSATIAAIVAPTAVEVIAATAQSVAPTFEHIVFELERRGYGPFVQIHNNEPLYWGWRFPIHEIDNWPELYDYLGVYRRFSDRDMASQRDEAVAFMIATGRVEYTNSKPDRFDAEQFLNEVEPEGYRFELTPKDRDGRRHYIEWFPVDEQGVWNGKHTGNYTRWMQAMDWKTRDDAQAVVAVLERRLSERHSRNHPAERAAVTALCRGS